ncbi:MAG: class I SAM-dependent methyltransferase, partial [Anaerolineae bacterium]|nr:class I SAM-dependent methyltransferase [Anaerolineae bacterium]
MTEAKPLSPLEFAWLGRDQWRTYTGPVARFFVRSFGPLGIHARIRNAHMIRILASEHPLEDASFLDAGCGHGYTLFWLARRCTRCQLHGVDLDASLISKNRQVTASLGIPHLRFTQGDAGDVGQPDHYDVIYSIDLLEHVDDDVAVLRSWRDALADDGLLVLHLPLRHQMQRRLIPRFRAHTISDHVRDEYTLDEIHEKLRLVGFRIDRTEQGFGLAGELAFELNNLFWEHPLLRTLAALVTLPLALALGYLDTIRPPQQGNSFLIVAR